MIPAILIRYWPQIGAALLVVAVVLWFRAHWIGVGEDRIRAQIETQRQAIEARYAALRTEDATRNAILADELALIRADYAELRDRPPVVLTQTREVRINEACTCPAVSLGPDFLYRYNEAARNP